MDIKFFEKLPEEAKTIRTEVFIDEQGFSEEFDGTDAIATHALLFENGSAVATCRYFYSDEKGGYMIGRIAVKKEHRGKGLGEMTVKAAEEKIKALGGNKIFISAQCRASGFYGKLGYEKTGDIYDDEGCPHILMFKNI